MSLIEKFMPLVLEKEEEGTQTPICVHQDVTIKYKQPIPYPKFHFNNNCSISIHA